jgi:hypothetical protein
MYDGAHYEPLCVRAGPGATVFRFAAQDLAPVKAALDLASIMHEVRKLPI